MIRKQCTYSEAFDRVPGSVLNVRQTGGIISLDHRDGHSDDRDRCGDVEEQRELHIQDGMSAENDVVVVWCRRALRGWECWVGAVY